MRYLLVTLLFVGCSVVNDTDNTAIVKGYIDEELTSSGNGIIWVHKIIKNNNSKPLNITGHTLCLSVNIDKYDKRVWVSLDDKMYKFKISYIDSVWVVNSFK